MPGHHLIFVDLYCGGGLGARGAVNAGAIPILAVDFWGKAVETYKANFPEAQVIESPVEELDPRVVLEESSVDILLASPECTSHSLARGAKPGCEKSRETAINIIPWIEAASPRWVVLENVARMKKWDRHNEMKDKIARLGYSISEMVLNAADFGSPQARKRLFLICDKKGAPPTLKDLEPYRVSSQLTASDVIDWSGKWNTTPLFKKGRAEPTLERARRAIKALGHGKPFIIVYYGTDYAGGWQRLDAPLRTITTLDRFALVTFEKNEYRMRMLQPPELLKAMGATGHQLPVGTRREKVRLCGNGVCSTVTEVIFREIKRKSQYGTSLMMAI